MGDYIVTKRSNNNNKPPSISDVAKLAEVSTSSVSRYLNHSESLTPAKRESIANAIKLLDYHPSLLAQGLASKRSNVITFFAGQDLLYGVVGCIKGVERIASQSGVVVNVILFDEHQSPYTLKQCIKSALSTNPLGIIIDQPRYGIACDEIIRNAQKDLPIVLIGGNRRKGQYQLFTHDDQGGYAITKYLLSLGSDTVYYVAPPEEDEEQTRQSGWKKALEEAGAVIPNPYKTSWDPLDAEKIGVSLGRRNDVTAIFAGNDEIALGVMRGLYSVGKHVPEDINVIGFDDNPIARLSVPALTTWHQDFELFGAYAAQIILDQSNGKAVIDKDEPHFIGHNTEQLVIRESTRYRKNG
ncbi:LacI family DNA-binding transcriptional regulator [Gardnerella sp. KA00390]|uniref:LacI family DNA-binding transcriptional regulator n=1 Tax=Gardnerella vaginalis TaxID=2702 RepID=UPI00030C1BD9|nr:LacI family DNA-binding transcriptional regulator [Gardnerella vaginalis]EPI53547.1 transcriptional regulator, LacI family [Gardnerella vaginalis JCP7672]EPI56827.1 transcriptional regulator, LacI family [Gardnerella vaginalis JCP7276]MBE0296911.1 LacI family DNA-binding transcriptional regulator [Gardnerella vaginalis]NSX25521.1 LacI family DNA-binding transcriptional regulator [Gardnerella vaginalis]